jgi:hypothetical protein
MYNRWKCLHQALRFAPRFARCLMLVLAVFVVLSARPAMAQGTSGMLPDPISSSELMRYADRLGLSEEQRAALERLHDDYRNEFRALRESDIERLLKRMNEMSGGMMAMPKRADVEQLMKDVERVSNRIEQIDARLFNQMQGILTEEQRADLPRVRLARERTRYLASQMMMGSMRPFVDLSEVAAEVNLRPAERDAIDPLLNQYEHQITRALKNLHDAAMSMYTGMFDAFESMEIDFSNAEQMAEMDPAEMQRMMEAMQDVMRTVYEPIQKLGQDIHEINRRTVRSIQPRLSETTGREFKLRFYRQAYPDSTFAHSISAFNSFDAALRIEGLNADTRAKLETARRDTTRRLDEILGEMIEAVDQRDAESSMFDFGGDAWRQFGERQRELRQQVNELDQNASQLVRDLIAGQFEELFTRNLEKSQQDGAQQAGRRPGVAPPPPPPTAHGEETDAEEDDVAQAMQRFQRQIPREISRRDLTVYARMLKVPDDRRVLLDELHATYLEQYKELEERWSSKLQRAEVAPYGARLDGERGGPSVDAVDHLFELRRRSLDEVMQTDEAFYADVRLALISEENEYLLDRVRWHRTRAVHDAMVARTSMWAGMSANQQGSVDLTRLVRLQRLSDEVLSRLDPLLHEYLQEAATLAIERYRLQTEFERVMLRHTITMQQRMEEDEDGFAGAMAFGMELQQALSKVAAPLQDMQKEIATLNARTLEAIEGELSDTVARALRLAFNRQAHPRIYRDASAIEQHLDRAFELRDLSSQQRERLTELAIDYRPAYAELSEQMVALDSGGSAMMIFGADENQMREMMNRRNEVARIAFERNELNARAIRQLRSILTEQQIEQLGGLPEPATERQNPWEWY